MKTFTISLAALAITATVAFAAERPAKPPARDTSQQSTARPVIRIEHEEQTVTPSTRVLHQILAAPAATEPAALRLDWYSINAGGETEATGGGMSLGSSLSQTVAGEISSATYTMGVGFWYGAAAIACPITVTGDVNLSGTITSADIIAMVNYVFKGGTPPQPCPAAGDVNCSGNITSADIIALVNFVFKGGTPPCDVCSIIPGDWSCP